MKKENTIFNKIEERTELGKGNVISLISFIIQGITALFLFLPLFKSTWMKNVDFGSWIQTDKISFVNFFTGRSTDIFCHITLILLIVGIVTFILMYMGNHKSFIKYTIFSPICSLLSFTIETFIITEQKISQNSSYYFYEFNWIFYVTVALFIIAVTNSILIIIGKIEPNEKSLKEKQKKSNNNLDDLKTLKELFDMDAITQKEYNIKKKEILNLSNDNAYAEEELIKISTKKDIISSRKKEEKKELYWKKHKKEKVQLLKKRQEAVEKLETLGIMNSKEKKIIKNMIDAIDEELEKER